LNLVAMVLLACCSLDFLTGHSQTHESLISDKKNVIVTADVLPFLDSMKAVNMELALEGFVMCLIEITPHDCPGKNLGLVDTEGLSMGLPRNDILRSIVGHIVKHVQELDRKGKLRRTKAMLVIDLGKE
jgi:hypothetical protein